MRGGEAAGEIERINDQMRDGSGLRKSKKGDGAAERRFVPGGRIAWYKCLPHFYRGLSPPSTNVSHLYPVQMWVYFYWGSPHPVQMLPYEAYRSPILPTRYK
jgi:hypothetical protein